MSDRSLDSTFVGNYGISINEGRTIDYQGDTYVELSHGKPYTVTLTNDYPMRCKATLYIDGCKVGSWLIKPHKSCTIERPTSERKKFTFFVAKHAPASSGIEPGKDTNGMVDCVFIPEKVEDVFFIKHHDEKTYPIKLDENATTLDLYAKFCEEIGESDVTEINLIWGQKPLRCTGSLFLNEYDIPCTKGITSTGRLLGGATSLGALKSIEKSGPSNWIAGATALGEKSNQKFRKSTKKFNAEDGAVPLRISVRLVGRRDENVDYAKYKHLPCTPLSNAVPMPVGD